MAPREEFTVATRDSIAKRAGFICSYPGCRRMTVAGSLDRKSGLTLTGVAAHISAAAVGGPRYDDSLRPEERSNEDNGIWVCQAHGKFIDDNATVCTVEELHRWKRQHERWVFDRVSLGEELAPHGTVRLTIREVGVLRGEHSVRFSRVNVLIGKNESGKTTIAEAIAAFSGGKHWEVFNRRFSFRSSFDRRSFVALTSSYEGGGHLISLSAQNAASQSTTPSRRGRIHVEIDGNVAVDWPRSVLRVIHFNDQLTIRRGDPKSAFKKGIKYLSGVFSIEERMILDSLRDDLYANSMFGFRFRKARGDRVEILVPGGRTFYLRPELLASSELWFALTEIAVRLVVASATHDRWLLIFDSGIFCQLDIDNKLRLFEGLTSFKQRPIQTLYCLHADDDAELIRQASLESWVGSERIGEMTLHTFS